MGLVENGSRTQDHSDLLVLPPVDLLHAVKDTDIKIPRTEYVSTRYIVVDGTPIDEDHARDLGLIMLGAWGQTQSVMLRVRQEDSLVYDVMDGYHRVVGIRMVSEEQYPLIKSEVYYNCDDEELFDQRILAANSVKAVQFPRLGSWMSSVWSLTPWKDKLTVAQAFTMADTDSSGRNLGLSDYEANTIKVWARTKARTWLMEVPTIADKLRTIEISDKSLVSRVRSGGSFGKGQLALTEIQLKTISTAFPREGEIQKLIAHFANGHGLSGKKIEILTAHLKGHSLEEVREELQNGDWRGIFERYNELAPKKRGRKKYNINVQLPVAKNELRGEIDNLRSKTNKLTRELSTANSTATEYSNDLQIANKKVNTLTQELEAANIIIGDLRSQLSTSHQSHDNEAIVYDQSQTPGNNGGEQVEALWKIIPDLDDQERAVFKCIFNRNMNIYDIADQGKTTPADITTIFLNGIRKYQMYKESNRRKQLMNDTNVDS